jgi:alcohol dehydrogenase (cytochrome c)/quinohemoprotein ethanol dehydrogenase
VFEGRAGGLFVAYDATTGQQLWAFDAQATAQGGPVGYQVGETEYIAIAIGNGGSSYLAGALGVPQKKGTPTGRVVAFRLDGTAPYPRVETALDPVPPPPVVEASAATLARGAAQFGAYCAGCHGFGAISGQVTPDLRRSGLIHSDVAFRQVVQGGALLSEGMPRFGAAISADDLEAIRAFLANEARYIYGQEHKIPSAPAAQTPVAPVDAGPQ